MFLVKYNNGTWRGLNDYNEYTMFVIVWIASFTSCKIASQRSMTGGIGTAWSLLQLSSPVLRPPNVDVNGFLLLSGARPVGLDLLDDTRVRVLVGVGVGDVGAAGLLSTTLAERICSCLRSCFAAKSSDLPLNSNPFLVFLFITTSGQFSRILPFILSSAKGSKDSNVLREYT